MTAFKDHIFIFDLHNTLYDEVIEYGGAMDAAIDCFFEHAKQHNQSLIKDDLYKFIAKGHGALGSDWDEDVWNYVATECGINNYEAIKQKTIDVRRKTSERLTKKHAYTDTLKTIQTLKKDGAQIYLATEATANAAADGVRWLGLDGVFDGVYSWPFSKPYETLNHTKQLFFPSVSVEKNIFLQKPHPHILATIILDIAKGKKLIPEDIAISDVFDTVLDTRIDISILLSKIEATPNNEQAMETINAIKTRITLKDSAYKTDLKELWGKCYYVGDSFFKDGFLARNADLPFIHAAYGKEVSAENQAPYEKARDTLYRVTGWPTYLLKLTQEAGRLPELTDKITPHFTCHKSFSEFVIEID